MRIRRRGDPRGQEPLPVTGHAKGAGRLRRRHRLPCSAHAGGGGGHRLSGFLHLPGRLDLLPSRRGCGGGGPGLGRIHAAEARCAELPADHERRRPPGASLAPGGAEGVDPGQGEDRWQERPLRDADELLGGQRTQTGGHDVRASVLGHRASGLEGGDGHRRERQDGLHRGRQRGSRRVESGEHGQRRAGRGELLEHRGLLRLGLGAEGDRPGDVGVEHEPLLVALADEPLRLPGLLEHVVRVPDPLLRDLDAEVGLHDRERHLLAAAGLRARLGVGLRLGGMLAGQDATAHPDGHDDPGAEADAGHRGRVVERGGIEVLEGDPRLVELDAEDADRLARPDALGRHGERGPVAVARGPGVRAGRRGLVGASRQAWVFPPGRPDGVLDADGLGRSGRGRGEVGDEGERGDDANGGHGDQEPGLGRAVRTKPQPGLRQPPGIGIWGSRRSRLLPSHTTGRAGPHPAVRAVEVGWQAEELPSGQQLVGSAIWSALCPATSALPRPVFFMNPNGAPCQMQDQILWEMAPELKGKAVVVYYKTTVTSEASRGLSSHRSRRSSADCMASSSERWPSGKDPAGFLLEPAWICTFWLFSSDALPVSARACMGLHVFDDT